MHNVNHKTLFTLFLFKQRKMNKQNRTVVKILKQSLIYPLGDEKANHVNFMQPMLISCSCFFSSLEGIIRKGVKNINLSTDL